MSGTGIEATLAGTIWPPRPLKAALAAALVRAGWSLLGSKSAR